MDTDALLKLAGQGGLSLIILGAFIWLIRTVGLALVAEIKGLRADINTHTDVDVAHHARVSNELAEIRGHFGIPTPVQGVPIVVGRQPSSPVRSTVRPKTEPGE